MPSIKTESKAVNALVSSIEDTSLMVPYIDQNDKTPIWDGFIYLYSNPCLTKDFFAGRAPVQVKGHEEDDLSKSRVTHDAKVVDLNAYLQDGGVIYFLIYVAADRRASKIYYASLTTEKLRGILKECKPAQEKKRILLDAFPEDAEEKTRIIREFIAQYRPVYRPPQPKPQEDIAFEKLPFLKELTCQRLTADPENFEKIQTVEIRQNPGIAAYMKHLAWEEDSDGQCAHYLIKNKDNEILMFFGLRAGVLFEPLDIGKLRDQHRDTQMLLDALEIPWDSTKMEQKQELIRKLGISEANPMREAHRMSREIYAKLEFLHAEQMTTPDHLAARAETAYPALELTHFYKNEAADIWKKTARRLGLGFRMGEVLFWLFVVCAILETRKQIGCQYVYTFVPDVTMDRRQVFYYVDSLNFSEQEDLAVVKPQYDFACPCLYQNIDGMKKLREQFFLDLFDEVSGGTASE